MDVQDEEGHESRCVFRNILYTCRRRSESEFREANSKRKGIIYNGLSKDTNSLTAHKKCNLEYKSSDHIKRHSKRSAASANDSQWNGGAIKHTRRSHSAIPFDFKSDFIFCGIACYVKTDDRHPNTHSKKKGMLSQTAGRRNGKKSV